MKKALKKMMLGMLVITMLVNGLLISNPSTAAAADAAEKQSVAVSGCILSSPALSEIQYQKFMSYLTQEYAPEMKAAWEQAWAERQSIQPDIDVQLQQGITSTEPDIKIKGSITENDKDLSPVSEIYVTETTTANDLITKSFTVNSNGNALDDSGVLSISITGSPETDGNFAFQLNLQNELDQAITSNDSKAINIVLGKMLANYKQITEDIKNRLSKVAIDKVEATVK